MRITRIGLKSKVVQDPLILSFQDPSSENPYQVTLLDGLGADDIGWNHTSAGYEATQRSRKVVVQVKLNPKWAAGESYSSLRDRLFRLVQSTRTGQLTLTFYDDEEVVASLSGQIVKMEPNVFTQEPEVSFEISCKNSMLLGPLLSPTVIPNANPQLFIINDQVSTAPHGGIFQFKFNAPMATFVLLGDETAWTFIVEPVGGFILNDILVISSLTNEKSVTLLRYGATTPIADAIRQGSVWPMIFPRSNAFLYSTNVTLQITKYPTAYWGI
jgi:hypothetical protein